VHVVPSDISSDRINIQTQQIHFTDFTYETNSSKPLHKPSVLISANCALFSPSIERRFVNLYNGTLFKRSDGRVPLKGSLFVIKTNLKNKKPPTSQVLITQTLLPNDIVHTSSKLCTARTRKTYFCAYEYYYLTATIFVFRRTF